MSVQIIINGENAQESLMELSALASGLNSSLKGEVSTATTKPESTQKRPSRSSKTVKNDASSTVVEEKSDAVENAVNTALEEEFSDDEPIPTDVELRAAATEKANTVGKVKVKGLLDKYNVKNVTGIPDEHRTAFLKELEALS